jgi:hypothetical protein
MRFIVRWLFRLMILAIVLVVAAVLLKDSLLKSWAERRLSQETGLEVRIGRLESGLLTPTLTLQDFRIYNPPEFGGGPMVDFPEVHFQWDPSALARRCFHLRLARIHLSEFTIVRGKNGNSNFDFLSRKLPALKNLDQKLPDLGGWTFTGIDTLNLTVERLRIIDLAHPGHPFEQNLGLRNEVIQNVRSFSDVMTRLTTKVIEQSLPAFLNANPKSRSPAPNRATNSPPAPPSKAPAGPR